MKNKFKSKVDNLKFLQKKLKSARIPSFKLYIIKKNNLKKISLRIFDDMNKSSIYIIRSSAYQEDQKNNSFAGHFDSFICSKGEGLGQISNYVIRIAKKFKEKKKKTNKIFVQEYINDAKISGVLFTKDPNDGSNYYVLNYNKGTETDVITSGRKGNTSTIYISHFLKSTKKNWVNNLIKLSKELEKKFVYDSLDIEFAINKKNKVFLLQVRPLNVKKIIQPDITKQKQILLSIKRKIKNSFKKHPYLLGKNNLLGVMPDWNPAEMIGIKPKTLAKSLYEELITDGTWAYQRDNYGYKNLRSFHLMDTYGPTPFIDIRVCFNSFIPKGLDKKISEKLVNFYLNKLKTHPHNHDKIEFEIVYSCLTFDFDRNKSELLQKFNTKEIKIIKKSLKELTNNIINGKNGFWLRDLLKIKELEKRQKIILHSNQSIEKKVFWLIEDCKRFGTLPFAGLARVGFIAIQILNSLRRKNLINNDQMRNFMESLSTEAKEMNKFFNKNNINVFLKKYGHLRPGTYEITSFRYDERPSLYFKKTSEKNIEEKIKNFKISYDQMMKIEKSLKKIGYTYEPLSLFSFLKKAIESREKLKFIFTKSVSDSLSLIKKMGLKYGINYNDLSFIDYKVFKNNINNTNIKEIIKANIKYNKLKYKENLFIKLPYLIKSPDDVYYFELDRSVPNFITNKKIIANTVCSLKNKYNLKNKIVFIKNADPGYDWLFTHQISGLVTEYGGVNSHMSIRANEIGLPAIIGAGNQLFEKWKQFKKLELDCKNKTVSKIQ
mgnify:CR=1 FL=1